VRGSLCLPKSCLGFLARCYSERRDADPCHASLFPGKYSHSDSFLSKMRWLQEAASQGRIDFSTSQASNYLARTLLWSDPRLRNCYVAEIDAHKMRSWLCMVDCYHEWTPTLWEAMKGFMIVNASGSVLVNQAVSGIAIAQHFDC
jgi:hypothetical protein